MAFDKRVVTGKPLRARNKFLREHREKLRKEAEERQYQHSLLTVPQKIAKLDAGGYVATKERARLAKTAMQAAFNATPAQQGEAAVEAAKKEKKGAKAQRQARKDKKARA